MDPIVKKVYFWIAGIPPVLFIVMLSSKELKGDYESFYFLFYILALFSLILGVWGVGLMVKSNKYGERVLSLGFATLIAISVFILLILQLIFYATSNPFNF